MEGVSARGVVASPGTSALGKPDRDLRRQPHHDRRRHRARVHRGRRRALRGLRLARPALRRHLDARRPAHRDRRRATPTRGPADHPAHATSPTARRRKQDTPEAHGAPLGEEEIRGTKRALRLARGRALPGARTTCASTWIAAPRGAELSSAWERALRRLPRRPSRPRGRVRARARAASCPTAGSAACRRSRPATSMATRARRAPRCCNAIAPRRPGARRRLGRPRGVEQHARSRARGDVSAAATTAGRNLHFGVREHGMGSILNGLIAARRLRAATARRS